MTSEFVTLTHDDPEFQNYILGTFSKELRALPVETYQSRHQRERVTFRLVPVEKLKTPSWWKVYFRSLRPELLSLTLGPALAGWIHHHSAGWEKWSSWSALAGIFFLHVATFLFTDVVDHIRGSDRMNHSRGSQVIQRGWASASEIRNWAFLNLALAIAFGLPVFASAPATLVLVCGLAAIALLFLVYNLGTRWGFCDLAVLLLFGPLLTSGVALASFGQVRFSDVILGLAFGAMTLWVFQIRQFENLFRSKPESFRTFLAYQNFDRARRIGIVEGGSLLAIHWLSAFVLGVSATWLWLLPLFSLPLVSLVYRLRSSSSPLSSALVHLSRAALTCQLAWAMWWCLALGFSWR